MSGALVYLILLAVVVVRFLNQKKGKDQKKVNSVPNQRNNRRANGTPFGQSRPLTSDGHRMPGDQDISCRRYGHRHGEFDEARYVPHSDPKDGYIVLNGVMMKLSEADDYENRI